MSNNQENHLIRDRRNKLNTVRMQSSENGSSAFPNEYLPESNAKKLVELYGDADNSLGNEADLLEERDYHTSIAGRVMIKRGPFVVIQDSTGRIQFYANKKETDPEVFAIVKSWDVGDIVYGYGGIRRSKTGDLYVKLRGVALLTKSLRPLPEKFHGLEDTETRYRQRYLDLISNESTRDTFINRSRIVSSIRQFMEFNGYMEVETPMLQTLPGGATASPFITHHNALDREMYLRIAPELYLKRLVVGGFDRVFEINRNFRNEGLSTRHNPEFTMIEFYQAYATYVDMMDMTVDMIRYVAENVFGDSVVRYGEHEFDVNEPFTRMTMRESIIEHTSLDSPSVRDINTLRRFASDNNVSIDDSWGIGRVQLAIFEEFVEEKLIEPTFITEYPSEVSPLARRSDYDPDVADRFEFFIGGREISNGFSELNDAEDQAERFRQQVADKEAGDDEAMYYDEDYITALEYGMPPTAGQGIGIDRLVMFFTNSESIKDVILFPAMR